MIKEFIELDESIMKKLGFIEEYRSKFTITYSLNIDCRFGYTWDKSFGWRIKYLGVHYDHIKNLAQFLSFYTALTGKEFPEQNC